MCFLFFFFYSSGKNYLYGVILFTYAIKIILIKFDCDYQRCTVESVFIPYFILNIVSILCISNYMALGIRRIEVSLVHSVQSNGLGNIMRFCNKLTQLASTLPKRRP